jgi:hypothetical protein
MTNLKSIVLIVFISIVSLYTNAQNTQDSVVVINDSASIQYPKKKRVFFYEQGINCTQFVKQYLSLTPTTVNNLPYLLVGNMVYGSIGLRYGLNIQNQAINESTTNTSFTSPFAPTNRTNTNISATNYRAGVFYHKQIGKRFSTNIGLDFVLEESKTSVKADVSQTSGNTTINTISTATTKRNSIGGGPIMAIQYYFTPKVSIGTETCIYVTSTVMEQKTDNTVTTTSTGFGGINSVSSNTIEDKTKEGGTNIIIPLSLFFYIRF